MGFELRLLSGSNAADAMLASESLRENLSGAGDRLLLVGHGADSIEDGSSRSRMVGSTRSTSRGLTWSQICLHSLSKLTRDDLSAQLAPLDRYGLAELSSALVDGLVALVLQSRDGLRARWTRASRQRRLQRL
jgi:hypothetical protein